jgi:hypothetical protein
VSEDQTWPLNSRAGDVLLDVPTDILCSFHYFSDVDMGVMASWGTRIIGDSGAFSAMSGGTPIDRETFHAWAKRWENDLFWVATLDVIGDPEGTYENWLASRRDGLSLVPTLHYGAAPKEMDRYVDQGVDFLGLGGMVPFSAERDRLMRWLIPMFKHARDNYPHVRFHGWGVSHPVLMDSLPWWSADSSGFSSAFRFATLRLFDPRKGKLFQVDLDGRSVAEHRHLLERYYGLDDWKRIAVSTPATRRDVGRVAIRAVQLYARWLQVRQQVTPPASLVARNSGPALASVMGYPGTAQHAALIPETGPVAVVAATRRDPKWLMCEDEVGPIAVAAVSSGSDSKSLHPGGDLPWPKVGPSAVAALGDSCMQGVKALNPDDLGL